jgi:predicted lipid-binding transport protein (Tim44 family)
MLGSWVATDPPIPMPRARTFMLLAGGIVLGLLLGTMLYAFARYFFSHQIGVLNVFVWLPLGVVVLTFVIEGIKSEIEKEARQAST